MSREYTLIKLSRSLFFFVSYRVCQALPSPPTFKLQTILITQHIPVVSTQTSLGR